MKKVLGPELMSEADARTIASGTPVEVLMHRAGWAVAREAVRLAQRAYGLRAVVVCGKGTNGGDGLLAAARLLGQGARPTVVLMNDEEALVPVAAGVLSSLRRKGVPVTGASGLVRAMNSTDVVIDAMLGTGSKGGLSGAYLDAAQQINLSDVPVVSVDLPSGVDAEAGNVATEAVIADVTVTLGAYKTGLLLHPGNGYTGRIVVEPIGIDMSQAASKVSVSESADVAALLKRRTVESHKRSTGKVLIVAGSSGMSGAATLAAQGALRAGAGLVRMAVPMSLAAEVDLRVAEALSVGLTETGSGSIEAAAVSEVLSLADSVDVVVLGPGLSRDPQTVEFVVKLLPELTKPLILDADGINAFEGKLESLARCGGPVLITPHAGELARLLGTSAEEVSRSRLHSASLAAKRTSCNVLLKGHNSVIVSPDENVVFNATGGPVLASAGTGDVLAGMAGALACEMDVFEAGWAAAHLHGTAGDLLAEHLGERGVMATDLLAILPVVLDEVMGA